AENGGAMYVAQRTDSRCLLYINNSSFISNLATSDGGAISTTTVRTEIVRSFFALNAGWDGGALNVIPIGREPTINISRSTFTLNAAARNGGAIANQRRANGVIENTSIVFNVAIGRGGGIYDPMRDLTKRNNTIIINTASLGGGIYAELSASGAGGMVN